MDPTPPSPGWGETGRRAALALAGAACIAAGAQLTVPMVPVPMTLQTLAVGCVGLLAGPRRGSLSAALYVAGVVVGLPILAEGASAGGASFFAVPSIGYVVAFVPAAAVAGWGQQRAPARSFAAACAAHVVVLAIGGSVLARHIGVEPAWEHGVAPFVAGAVVKSAAAAAIATGWWTWTKRSS